VTEIAPSGQRVPPTLALAVRPLMRAASRRNGTARRLTSAALLYVTSRRWLGLSRRMARGRC
jgi:hypothetical protein